MGIIATLKKRFKYLYLKDVCDVQHLEVWVGVWSSYACC
jgi:hypothetical protein